MARMTLAELNARMDERDAAWDTANPGYTKAHRDAKDLERWGATFRYERFIGRVGRANSGSHSHLVLAQVIASIADGPEGDKMRRNRWKVGDHFSASAPCNHNGQHVARAIKGYDTDRITCKHCIKTVEG